MRQHPPVRDDSRGGDALSDEFSSFSASFASTTSTDDECFFRKPDFQLRDCGASAPDVSFSQKASSRACRHPSILTTAAF